MPGLEMDRKKKNVFRLNKMDSEEVVYGQMESVVQTKREDRGKLRWPRKDNSRKAQKETIEMDEDSFCLTTWLTDSSLKMESLLWDPGIMDNTRN